MSSEYDSDIPSLLQGDESSLYSGDYTYENDEQKKRRKSSFQRLSALPDLTKIEAYKIANMSPLERAERIKYLKELVS